MYPKWHLLRENRKQSRRADVEAKDRKGNPQNTQHNFDKLYIMLYVNNQNIFMHSYIQICRPTYCKKKNFINYKCKPVLL